MPHRVTNEEDLRRYARRLVEGEAFLLAIYVLLEGWTPEALLRLTQIAMAATYTDRLPPASHDRLS